MIQAFAANSYSQSNKLSLNLKNVSAKMVLRQIEDKTQYFFIYDASQVDVEKKVDIEVDNLTVDEILDKIFTGTNVVYKINNRQIALSIEDTVESSQQQKTITGRVTDASGVAIPGVTVVVNGQTKGTITDINGNYSLTKVPDNTSLVFSFVGMKSQKVKVDGRSSINVTMQEEVVGLGEVVAVGYGVQKKASVVGAISTATNKELQRSGGVNNLGQALTGKLPGVTTLQTTGQPGKDDPKIYIRGQGTWNGGQPYILVDGVERKMNDLDMSEVENISVLKDASATAVYGVKGANGVILITTQRGTKGKPMLSLSANTTVKWSADLSPKLDSYDMYMVKNDAIAREVPLLESMWADYTPMTIAQRYRNQQSLKYPEAYPNVDWQKVLYKPYAIDNRVNMNVSGGTDFAKYFSTLAYSNQSDLMDPKNIGRGYTPGFGYDKFNFRTNLDLNITKTTSLKMNLAGVYSILKTPSSVNEYYLSGYYVLPPNAFLPQYADGRWGKSLNSSSMMVNSAAVLANWGYNQTRSTDLTSDFSITQKLDFITRGLSATANLSFDNHFETVKSISESQVFPQKYIDPAIEDMPAGGDPNAYITIGPVAGTNQYSWVQSPWVLSDENADNSLSMLRRRLYTQIQFNYARTFGKHDVTATGVFTREQLATGSEFQRYREDWIGRATYNYDNRFFGEFNGAYNGSEKFGPDHRFAFFPSGAIGWTISNEQFMKGMQNWLDKLKFRASYGKIGDDGGLSQRWMYQTQWEYGGLNGGQLPFSQYVPITAAQKSPYIMYNEKAVGNPDVQWETALKSNFGMDITVLNNLLSADLEYFTEDRTNILLAGSSRVLPPYFGTEAPTANVGEVTKKGYEFELKFNKTLKNWHLWAEASMTHAVDKVISKEEPGLKDPHLLAAGFQIDQIKTIISNGFVQNWNQIYGTTPNNSNDALRLPGNYNLIDFNADGVIDPNKDSAPFGYSTRPQNNYNFSLGVDYKGFSAMVQFYGVNNVTRYVPFVNFEQNLDIAYSQTLDHWSIDNPDASYFLPRWKTAGGQNNAQAFLYDGSYLRLKTAELSFTFNREQLKHFRMSSLKIYLNGNNLLFWSKMPDDREQGGDRYSTYPTSKRVNLGVEIKF